MCPGLPMVRFTTERCVLAVLCCACVCRCPAHAPASSCGHAVRARSIRTHARPPQPQSSDIFNAVASGLCTVSTGLCTVSIGIRCPTRRTAATGGGPAARCRYLYRRLSGKISSQIGGNVVSLRHRQACSLWFAPQCAPRSACALQPSSRGARRPPAMPRSAGGHRRGAAAHPTKALSCTALVATLAVRATAQCTAPPGAVASASYVLCLGAPGRTQCPSAWRALPARACHQRKRDQLRCSQRGAAHASSVGGLQQRPGAVAVRGQRRSTGGRRVE
jgi:hypothetical protein